MATFMQSARSVAGVKSFRAQRASRSARNVVVVKAQKNIAQAAAAALISSALIVGSADALTYDEIQGLTYLEVKGSGIANTCPVLTSGTEDVSTLGPGNYKFQKLCLEPSSFTVREESNFKNGGSEFVPTKLMTRMTYTLDEIEGDLKVGSNGEVSLATADSGMDYAAVTVQMPGGERVPFLFTVKQLNAKGTADAIFGDFVVPSYRGATFMDPKGRGSAQGWDNAVALPARADDESLARENIKTAAASKGSAVLRLAKYDADTGEIAGVFESIQPSDNDLGAKTPKDVKIMGTWYAQLLK